MTETTGPVQIRQISATALKSMMDAGETFELVDVRTPEERAIARIEGAPLLDQDVPLLIEFAAPSSLLRERHRASDLPIVGNGPPGTFVVFAGGLRVSLPTDQIVFADDSTGYARVGFGGMRFDGIQDGRLTFTRFREVLADAQLSPARSHTMRLETEWVTAVIADGRRVRSA